jgi:predicted Zn-dependent protease
MQEKRRGFLSHCALVAFLGIELSMPVESFASGIFSNPDSFCRTNTFTPENASLGNVKWNRKHFRYHIASRDNYDLAGEVWDEEFRLAFDSWSEVVPLTFEQVEGSKEYDLYITTGRRKREGFGKAGGTLAWAQLPSGRKFDGILMSKFDLAERWVLPNKEEEGVILRSVAAHEIGHLLGLRHSTDRGALMYPYINNSLKPMADDIKAIQRLYGKK